MKRSSDQHGGKSLWRQLLISQTVLLCLALSLISSTARAETPPAPTDSARTVVEQMFRAVQERDWVTYASFVHPQELAKFRKLMLPFIWLLDSAGQAGNTLPLFFNGAKSYSEVAALDSVNFFAGTFGMLTQMVPGFGETMTSANVEIIGSVKEGADTTHFVCMMHAMDGEVATSELQVATLMRLGGLWYAMLRFDAEQLAKAIQR